jgi:hypothetical protein
LHAGAVATLERNPDHCDNRGNHSSTDSGHALAQLVKRACLLGGRVGIATKRCS